jgi:hypothetical protein
MISRYETPNKSPEPTCLGASVLRLSVWVRHVTVPTWLCFFLSLHSRVMAYLCIIASVPRNRAEDIRVPADIPRLASRAAYASHFIVPASTELRNAMDGGTPLDTDTRHPLRGFMIHEPAAVQERATQLTTFAAQMGETGHPLHGDTWTQAEATKVIDLFQHASTAGEAVVTHLDLTRTGKRKS